MGGTQLDPRCPWAAASCLDVPSPLPHQPTCPFSSLGLGHILRVTWFALHRGKQCRQTRIHTHIAALVNHDVLLLSWEGHVTQNLRKGTGTAKRLGTTQRHEQKRNGKLFLNKMRSELDWRENGNLFRRDSQKGVLPRC